VDENNPALKFREFPYFGIRFILLEWKYSRSCSKLGYKATSEMCFQTSHVFGSVEVGLQGCLLSSMESWKLCFEAETENVLALVSMRSSRYAGESHKTCLKPVQLQWIACCIPVFLICKSLWINPSAKNEYATHFPLKFSLISCCVYWNAEYVADILYISHF